MSVFTVQRLATPEETAAEMDRRGAVIEKLETDLRHWREECGKLHAQIAITGDSARRIARGTALTDGMLDNIIRATGEWCEPHESPRESGVAVDNDISQADADAINAEARVRLRELLEIAARFTTSPAPPQIVIDAYLGITVLRTMCKKAGLTGGTEASDQLLSRMAQEYPSLPGLSALRG